MVDSSELEPWSGSVGDAGVRSDAAGDVPGDAPVSSCTFYASGSTSGVGGTGSHESPFATVQRLMQVLSPGQVGCILGTMNEDVTISEFGTATAPITLTSAPDGQATIHGRIVISKAAGNVVITALNIDGSASPEITVQVYGTNVTLSQNDITNSHGALACIIVGSTSIGDSFGALIERNRIHECGTNATSGHGIALESARSVRVLNNVIYANAGNGVQLYVASGSTIDHNVIDLSGSSGVIFSGRTTLGSSDNVVSSNIVTNALTRYNIESNWDGPVGTNNAARNNCVWNGALGNIDTSSGGFTATGNPMADPMYMDSAHGNYTLAPGSPCAAMGPQP
jgi:parallel beta-helix repeat protein